MFIEGSDNGGGGGSDFIFSDYYILKHRQIIIIDAKNQFNKWYRCFYHRKIRTKMVNGFFISTVFLAIAYNPNSKGPPLLFETMIFPEKESDYYITRCATHRQALHMHRAAVDYVKQLDAIK